MPVDVPGHNAPRPPVPAPGGDQEWRAGVAAIQSQLASDPGAVSDLHELLDGVDTAYVGVLEGAYAVAGEDPQQRAMARAATSGAVRTAVEQETQALSEQAAEADQPTPEPEPEPAPEPEQPPTEG